MAIGIIENNGWKLVWTNPSPSTQFAPQTLSLDLSSYDAIALVWKMVGNHNNGCITSIIFLNSEMFTLTFSDFTVENNICVRTRNITASQTQIVFAQGKMKVHQQAAVDSEAVRPLQIYAFKFAK